MLYLNTKFIFFIHNSFLSKGKAPDDLVLEIVIFLGTAAFDEDCARLLCKADILLSLIELLKGLYIIRNINIVF